MENSIIKLTTEIHFCPYCGSPNLVKVEGENLINCDDCGRDFAIMAINRLVLYEGGNKGC